MKRFYPHIYFWLTALFVIIISEISFLNISDNIVINNKDTYYVISRREVGIVFSGLYVLIGCIYWIFQRIDLKLNTYSTAIHTIVSSSTVVVYFVFLIYYSYFKVESLFDPSNETYINLILIFTTILIQVHFIYNCIHSIIKYKTQN